VADKAARTFPKRPYLQCLERPTRGQACGYLLKQGGVFSWQSLVRQSSNSLTNSSRRLGAGARALAREPGHINGDPSDNQIANLRDATHAENQHNAKKRINNASGYTGISWIERARKWRVRINVAKHEIYLGRFDDLNTARRTYLAAKRILHPFAPTPRGTTPP
jgi:hypothetical protein